MELLPLQVPLLSLIATQMVGVKYYVDRCLEGISDSNLTVKDPNANGNQNLPCHSTSEWHPHGFFEEHDHW